MKITSLALVGGLNIQNIKEAVLVGYSMPRLIRMKPMQRDMNISLYLTNYEHQSNHKQTPKSTDTAWERIENGRIKEVSVLWRKGGI